MKYIQYLFVHQFFLVISCFGMEQMPLQKLNKLTKGLSKSFSSLPAEKNDFLAGEKKETPKAAKLSKKSLSQSAPLLPMRDAFDLIKIKNLEISTEKIPFWDEKDKKVFFKLLEKPKGTRNSETWKKNIISLAAYMLLFAYNLERAQDSKDPELKKRHLVLHELAAKGIDKKEIAKALKYAAYTIRSYSNGSDASRKVALLQGGIIYQKIADSFSGIPEIIELGISEEHFEDFKRVFEV